MPRHLLVSIIRPLGFYLSRIPLINICEANSTNISIFSNFRTNITLPRGEYNVNHIHSPSKLSSPISLIRLYCLAIKWFPQLFKSKISLLSFNIPNIILFSFLLPRLTFYNSVAVVTGFGRIGSATFFSIIIRYLVFLILRFTYAHVVVQNSFDQKYANRVLGSNRVHLIHGAGINVSTLDAIRSKRSFVLNSVDHSSSLINISFIGRPLEQKGFLSFVDFAEYCHEANYSHFRFHHFGDESHHLSYRISLIPNLIEHGFQSDHNYIYSQTDVILYLSDYADGLPRSLLEGLTSGCIVVCKKNPVLEDLQGIFPSQVFFLNQDSQVIGPEQISDFITSSWISYSHHPLPSTRLNLFDSHSINKLLYQLCFNELS